MTFSILDVIIGFALGIWFAISFLTKKRVSLTKTLATEDGNTLTVHVEDRTEIKAITLFNKTLGRMN